MEYTSLKRDWNGIPKEVHIWIPEHFQSHVIPFHLRQRASSCPVHHFLGNILLLETTVRWVTRASALCNTEFLASASTSTFHHPCPTPYHCLPFSPFHTLSLVLLLTVLGLHSDGRAFSRVRIRATLSFPRRTANTMRINVISLDLLLLLILSAEQYLKLRKHPPVVRFSHLCLALTLRRHWQIIIFIWMNEFLYRTL